MKKSLVLFVSCMFSMLVHSQYYRTYQVGNTFSFTGTNADAAYLPPAIAFSINGSTINMKAVARGTGFITQKANINYYYVYKIVDVINIDIPEKIELAKDENYTYTPIITDAEATTTLTWKSSDATVATVDNNGIVSAVGIGKATITCTATNGISAQSIVTVSPVLAQEVSLDKQECELSVDESIQLTSTISPENVTSTKVKWLSSNENVAQVDDTGNVTAIAPGYCSIYSIADDGSRKYDKCLFHVLGNGTNVYGDVNGDGSVTVTDATTVIGIILNKE